MIIYINYIAASIIFLMSYFIIDNVIRKYIDYKVEKI